MKTLSQIAEAISGTAFTEAELIKDYESIGGLGIKDKKVLAAKYNASSPKAADLQKAILENIRVIRSTKSQFTKDDIRWFHRIGMYDRYDKFKEIASKESEKFISFYKDVMFDDLKKRGLDKKIGWSASELRYGTSYADQSMLSRYNNAVKYLAEIDPENIASAAAKTTAVTSVLTKLTGLLTEFKKAYLSKIQKYAEDVYDHAPERLNVCTEKLKEIEDQMHELVYATGKYNSSAYWSNEYRSLEKDKNRYSRGKAEAKYVLSLTKSKYVADALEEGEKSYEATVKALAEKIDDKGINADNMTVKRVADDPKLFELMVTDGEKNLYARSVWAAEYSDKMVPHFRFIITNRK